MSPGADSDPSVRCLAVNTALDHEKLCALDVLELADSPSGNQGVIYEEFRMFWDVLVRGRFHPIALTGDVKKAFLQVRIAEKDRDTLRFHWLRSVESNKVETLRFTRALFGLGTSPFLLGGVIKQHLIGWNQKRADSVAEISRSLYVDDLISGANNVSKAQTLKTNATEIFADAGFPLHKWHSNAAELEDVDSRSESNEETTYAKEQLGSAAGKCKFLGLSWNKRDDTISVSFPKEI